MKVFISWSGEQSHKVACLLSDLIQDVIQSIRPFLSSKDIDRGAIWFNEISNQLQESSFGVVCLTKENKDKPWILFESGALAKGLTGNRVCTFLVDLTYSDVENPLAQFNHTTFTKDSLFSLFQTFNKSLGDIALSEGQLQRSFNVHWNRFEVDFKELLKTEQLPEQKNDRSDGEKLSELIEVVRDMRRTQTDILTEEAAKLKSSSLETHTLQIELLRTSQECYNQRDEIKMLRELLKRTGSDLR